MAARVPKWSKAAASARLVISRVDGTLDVSDLASLTGVAEEEVERVLAPLVAEGAIVFVDVPSAAPSSPPGALGAIPDERGSQPMMPAVFARVAPEEQQRILETYESLNRIDHYRLLGVAATADQKAIKRAYYARAKLHHPDRFYTKDVGALRPKIDAIFAAMSAALETLADPERRASYDAYLRDSLKTRMARRSAEALETKNDWVGAAEAWRRVVEQLATDAYVQHRHAYTLLRARAIGAYPTALAAARRAIELDPTRAEYRLTAASLYLASGLEASALGELAVVSELEASRPEIAGLHAALSARARGR